MRIKLSALSKCQILIAKEQVKKLALDSKTCIFWLTIYPIKKTIRDIVLKVQIYQLLQLGNRNWIRIISPNICKIMRQRRLFQCKEIRLLNKIRVLNHLLVLRLLLLEIKIISNQEPNHRLEFIDQIRTLRTYKNHSTKKAHIRIEVPIKKPCHQYSENPKKLKKQCRFKSPA